MTFLCARFSRAELVDALQYSSLTVEVHDRDLKQEEKLSKLQRKWETLHATGVDITAVTSQHTQGQNNQHTSEEIPTPGTGGASRTTTPRTGATHAQYQQQAPKSMEIFLVDDVAKQDCRLLLSRSGDFFPHGLATFRLNELLNKVLTSRLPIIAAIATLHRHICFLCGRRSNLSGSTNSERTAHHSWH